jgi:hypothetical protein
MGLGWVPTTSMPFPGFDAIFAKKSRKSVYKLTDMPP